MKNVKVQLPDRKQMNEDVMADLVSEKAEIVGGDHIVMGELFMLMFADLSAAKQEHYIARLRAEIKELRGYTK